MPRPSAARPCVRCGHAEAKHNVMRSRECTVRVPVRKRGSSRRGTAKLIYCDCPGYLGTDSAQEPVPPPRGIGSAVRNG